MIRSKGKKKLYDEKGVFGRVCRIISQKDLWISNMAKGN